PCHSPLPFFVRGTAAIICQRSAGSVLTPHPKTVTSATAKLAIKITSIMLTSPSHAPAKNAPLRPFLQPATRTPSRRGLVPLPRGGFALGRGQSAHAPARIAAQPCCFPGETALSVRRVAATYPSATLAGSRSVRRYIAAQSDLPSTPQLRSSPHSRFARRA